MKKAEDDATCRRNSRYGAFTKFIWKHSKVYIGTVHWRILHSPLEEMHLFIVIVEEGRVKVRGNISLS
jgi:hypothetical protein